MNVGNSSFVGLKWTMYGLINKLNNMVKRKDAYETLSKLNMSQRTRQRFISVKTSISEIIFCRTTLTVKTTHRLIESLRDVTYPHNTFFFDMTSNTPSKQGKELFHHISLFM